MNMNQVTIEIKLSACSKVTRKRRQIMNKTIIFAFSSQFTWQLRKLLIVMASHVISISGYKRRREGAAEADLLALGRKVD